MRFPGDVVQTLKVTLQTAAVGPGGVEILVVIVLLKFLKQVYIGISQIYRWFYVYVCVNLFIEIIIEKKRDYSKSSTKYFFADSKLW